MSMEVMMIDIQTEPSKKKIRSDVPVSMSSIDILGVFSSNVNNRIFSN